MTLWAQCARSACPLSLLAFAGCIIHFRGPVLAGTKPVSPLCCGYQTRGYKYRQTLPKWRESLWLSVIGVGDKTMWFLGAHCVPTLYGMRLGLILSISGTQSFQKVTVLNSNGPGQVEWAESQPPCLNLGGRRSFGGRGVLNATPNVPTLATVHDALVGSGTASSKIWSWEFLSSLSEAVGLDPKWKMSLAIMNLWDLPNPPERQQCWRRAGPSRQAATPR